MSIADNQQMEIWNTKLEMQRYTCSNVIISILCNIVLVEGLIVSVNYRSWCCICCYRETWHKRVVH